MVSRCTTDGPIGVQIDIDQNIVREGSDRDRSRGIARHPRRHPKGIRPPPREADAVRAGDRIGPDRRAGVAVDIDRRVERPTGLSIGDGAADGVPRRRREGHIQRGGDAGRDRHVRSDLRLITEGRHGDRVGVGIDRESIETVGIGRYTTGLRERGRRLHLSAGDRLERLAIAHHPGDRATAARDDGGLDRGEGVDLTPARSVVGHVAGAGSGAAPGHVGDRRGRLLDERLRGGIVAHHAGSSAPHQRDQPGHMRGCHRGAAHPTVGAIGPGTVGRTVGARRHDLRLERRIAAWIDRVGAVGGSPGRVDGVLTVARAGGADPRHVTGPRRVAHRVEAGRRGVTAVAGVAVGEDGVDPRGMPGRQHAIVPVIVALTTVAPRVVDDVRA